MREMKNSGVAWIGEIPAEWDVLRNKNLVYEINERCDADTRLPLLSVSEYYGVAPKAEKTDENTILSRAETLEGYKICEPDDVAMNIMLAWKRAQAVSKYHGIISPAYCVYRKKEDAPLNMDFFHYLIRSDLYINIYKRYSTGIIESRLRLYPEKFLSLHSHVPPIVEQQEIAKVLDVKSSQIDILIANQEAQIEKLKQYKQSLITEVVTKGLNPDVEMKDSGVEWIGEIPKHWDVVSTKQLFDIESGATPKSDVLDYFDGDIVWITPADYKTEDVYVSKGRRNITKEGLMSCSATLIPTGSLIFSKRAPIGSVAISATELCTNQGCLSCIPKTDDDVKFYYYFTSVFTEEFNLLGSGTTFKEISATNFANFKVTRPNKDIQKELVSYLDTQCGKIDKLIKIKQSKIAKLNEYKKSLIYEYVTGKKEA